MSFDLQNAGWIRDDDAVDAVTIALSADVGHSIEVSKSLAMAPDGEPLKGFAQRQIARGVTGVFPWEAEKKLLGNYGKSWDQRRGTCVGQGSGRGAQDAWYVALADRGEVGRVVEIAWEVIYMLARVQIGKGRVRGDGAVVGWAIQAMHDYGLCPRGPHGRYDLTRNNEQLACALAVAGRGAPQELIDASKGVEISALRCMSGDDVADCAFAKHIIIKGYSYTYADKDRNGISRLTLPANHCTEDLGAAVSQSGGILIGGQQSWRASGKPAGPNVVTYKGGTHPLREGMCMVPVEDHDRAIRNGGEYWAIQIKHGKGFRPE